MRIDTPFDPIEVGEIDYFCFDFTYDLGASIILSSQFNCYLASHQNVIDVNPQSHVIAVITATLIAVREPPGAVLINQNGNFIIGQIGGFDNTMIGGTYILEATATTNDSPARVLKLNATVQCVGINE